MNDIIKFVETLELLESPMTSKFNKSYLELSTEDSEKGFLNYKSLQSFVTGVSSQHQEDVLNSVLLAQRAASKAFPSDEEIDNWYQKYYSVLERLGWVLENKNFSIFKNKQDVFEIDKALLEILGTALTGNQLAIVLKTIETLKSFGEDDSRFAFFEKSTHSAQTASFQIGLASEDGNNISLTASSFVLKTKKKITKVLFFTSKKDSVEFRFNLFKATLNEGIYSQARESIKVKLGDVSDYVSDLEI